MSISSLLFRGQPESRERKEEESASRSRSLRRMLKPFPAAAESTKAAAADDDGTGQNTPAGVLDRLAQFAARR